MDATKYRVQKIHTIADNLTHLNKKSTIVSIDGHTLGFHFYFPHSEILSITGLVLLDSTGSLEAFALS